MTSINDSKSLTVIEAEFTEPAPAVSREAEAPPQTEDAPAGATLRQWFAHQIKRILPRRLFARSLIIIVAPVVITQGVVTYVFFERHWDTVTRHLSAGVAGDIAMLIETYEKFPAIRNIEELTTIALRTEGLSIVVMPNERLPTTQKSSFFSVLDRTLRRELAKKLDRPFWIDTTRYPNWVDIRVQLNTDVLRIVAPRERVFAPSGPIFVLWMVGTSLVILSIAIIFLRNQVRPIQRLAEAAASFGKGREVSDFKPTGATEVRRAAESFLEMRDRIRRQIEQRTSLLAGVSHDLRTPLTRMKLQVALMERSAETEALQDDINEMEHMLEEYLAFARGQGGEAATLTDIGMLLNEVGDEMRRTGHSIGIDLRGDLRVPVRRNAIKRCLANLVENAVDFGDKVAITAQRQDGVVSITIDDNGPGIPEDQIEDAFKPFHRLDESRNLDRSGVGLGLAIALDVARAHGGELTLSRSPWNGLRAKLVLPV